MQRLAKILYTINSITCIFIGLLHTHAHYTSLVSEELAEMMNHTVLVTGTDANVYNLWQGMSLMMGLLLIIVGLSHLLIISKIERGAFPPIGGSLILILMLVFVIYAGYYFFGGWQVYGGAMGILLQGICLGLSIRGK